jgi:hypothetical protein
MTQLAQSIVMVPVAAGSRRGGSVLSPSVSSGDGP